MRMIKLLIFTTMAIIAALIFPLRQPSVARISVMTFNIENGGTQIDFNKVVEAVKKSNADVVGIQEAWGHTSLLAQRLGWKYYNNRQHIVSRFPLHVPNNSRNLYTLVEVKPGYVIAIANMHLPDDSYGPDMLRQGANSTAIIAKETQVRLPTALPFIQQLSTLAKRGIPVFLTGDFNSPSHLDWKHHQPAIEWPVTKTIEDYGLIDAYRQLYPNAAKNIASTWPAGRPVAKHSFDGFNPSQNDQSDRLDFIYTGGNSEVLAVSIIGEPGYDQAKIHIWPWPSDHRAVVARFKVIPVAMSSLQLKFSTEKNISSANPQIFVNKHRLKSGEPITISWKNAPGNRYDYIMLNPISGNKTAWGEAVRLYTYGEANGSIVYDQRNVKGNWLAWYTGHEGLWPIKPGIYVIKLMLDDGYTELAKTKIIIRTT